MMKRLVCLVTMIFAVALLGLVGGCGKLNDQEPAAHPAPATAKDAGAPTNGEAGSTGAVRLAGGAAALEGELKAGGTNAQQTIVSPDGTVYTGEVKDGKPEGWGTLTDARGTYQKGEWRNGAAYRISGTCVLADGTREEGTWNDDGTKCGGTIWFADKRIYKGDWVIVDGQPELPYGAGTMTWPDGRQYAGHFINGKLDGIGKMTYPDGRVEDGSWTQDAFVVPAK
jgi:hypothetical protein